MATPATAFPMVPMQSSASSVTSLPLRPALKHSSRPSSPSSRATPLQSPNGSPPPRAASAAANFPRTDSQGSNTKGSGYTTKVSFDTFMNPCEDAMFSYTLQMKSEGYKKTRLTRVYLVASSDDESGKQALEWALESLVEHGDELVVVRGFDSDDLKDDHDQIREEAKELMRSILDKNSEFEGRSLSVIVEFVAGKVTDTIDRMTSLYRPDSLVVGTRGQKSLMQTWGAAFSAPGSVGSVSKYCVSSSPVPVIVVRPERKVKKSIDKRRADPKRRAAFEELSRVKTSHI